MLNVSGRPVPASQEGVVVSLSADVYRNRPPGGPYGECVETEVVGAIELRATVGLADLYGPGLTLTDEVTGTTFTIRITGRRDEL